MAICTIQQSSTTFSEDVGKHLWKDKIQVLVSCTATYNANIHPVLHIDKSITNQHIAI